MRDVVLKLDRLGLQGVTLHDAATEPLGKLSALERRVATVLEPYRAYLTQTLRVDDTRATALLSRCGVTLPVLGPAEVRALIDLAVGGQRDAASAVGSTHRL